MSQIENGVHERLGAIPASRPSLHAVLEDLHVVIAALMEAATAEVSESRLLQKALSEGEYKAQARMKSIILQRIDLHREGDPVRDELLILLSSCISPTFPI